MTLTKDDLAKAIAESNGFPLNRSQELVETLLELIKTELTAGKMSSSAASANSALKKSTKGEGGILQR